MLLPAVCENLDDDFPCCMELKHALIVLSQQEQPIAASLAVEHIGIHENALGHAAKNKSCDLGSLAFARGLLLAA